MRLLDRWPHTRDLVIGNAILAAAFVPSFPGVIHASGPPTTGGILVAVFFVLGGANLIWLALAAAVSIYGGVKRRPGMTAAPFVFCALWLASSVVLRCAIQIVDSGGNWRPPVPSSVRGERTLIVDYWWEIGTNVLAVGAVDRFVKITRDNNTHKITEIIETTIGRGDECSAEELRVSGLRFMGRTDECFKKRHLDTTPDGLIIASHHDIDFVHGHTGCCNTVEVSRKEGQRNEQLLVWRQGYLHVPSYVPYYARPYPLTVTDEHQPGIWQPNAGPWQVVRYGLADITPNAVIAALYGVDPREPLVRSVPEDQLIERAEVLAAKGTFADAHAALRLASEAQRRGIGDDRAVRVAAAVVGFEQFDGLVGSDFDPFVRQLSEASISPFLDAVFERLATPHICGACRESRTSWYGLRERLKDPSAWIARARQTFEGHVDLDVWQYEAALRFIDAFARVRPEYRDLPIQLAKTIENDEPGQPRRVALGRVFRNR